MTSEAAMDGAAAPAQDVTTPVNDAGSSFAIPEGYTGKGWTEKVKSYDDLWKLADNSQALIGRRVAPADDASAEEWENFYKTVGKPDAPDKYQLQDIDGIPEGFDLTDFKTQAQELMFEAGLNQRQANALYQAYLKSELEVAGKNKAAIEEHNKALDAEFDKITAELYGDKFPEVSAKAQEFIKQNLPEQLLPEVQALSDNPKALAAVIALADKAQKAIADVKAKYGAEDALKSGQQAAGSTSREEVLKKLTESKMAAQKLDPFSPERKKMDGEIQELRGQLQKFFS